MWPFDLLCKRKPEIVQVVGRGGFEYFEGSSATPLKETAKITKKAREILHGLYKTEFTAKAGDIIYVSGCIRYSDFNYKHFAGTMIGIYVLIQKPEDFKLNMHPITYEKKMLWGTENIDTSRRIKIYSHSGKDYVKNEFGNTISIGQHHGWENLSCNTRFNLPDGKYVIGAYMDCPAGGPEQNVTDKSVITLHTGNELNVTVLKA